MTRTVHALAALTVTLVRRLLREGVVLRSLAFPALLCAGAILLTVVGVTVLRPPQSVGVTAGLDTPALVADATAKGWSVTVVEDPAAAVDEERVTAATDGHTIWRKRSSTAALGVEALLRQHLKAGWWMDVSLGQATRQRSYRSNEMLLRFIGALFAMYGVVFGAGSVARDRDEGTLAAEVATAVPRWVHGTARWLASTFVLGAFYVFGVALFHSLVGMPDPVAVALHGVAASSGSAALGIAVVGRAGMAQGFVAPLSVGLVLVTSLLGWGFAANGPEQWIPIASVLSEGTPGGGAAAMSVLWGIVGIALFTWRSTTE